MKISRAAGEGLSTSAVPDEIEHTGKFASSDSRSYLKLRESEQFCSWKWGRS